MTSRPEQAVPSGYHYSDAIHEFNKNKDKYRTVPNLPQVSNRSNNELSVKRNKDVTSSSGSGCHPSFDTTNNTSSTESAQLTNNSTATTQVITNLSEDRRERRETSKNIKATNVSRYSERYDVDNSNDSTDESVPSLRACTVDESTSSPYLAKIVEESASSSSISSNISSLTFHTGSSRRERRKGSTANRKAFLDKSLLDDDEDDEVTESYDESNIFGSKHLLQKLENALNSKGILRIFEGCHAAEIYRQKKINLDMVDAREEFSSTDECDEEREQVFSEAEIANHDAIRLAEGMTTAIGSMRSSPDQTFSDSLDKSLAMDSTYSPDSADKFAFIIWPRSTTSLLSNGSRQKHRLTEDLGIYFLEDHNDQAFVQRVSRGSLADQSGVEQDDVVLVS